MSAQEQKNCREMKKVKSILKGSAVDAAEDAKATEASEPSIKKPETPAKPGTATLLNTDDLTMDQVRSTLQLVNKMLRKEAKPQELAALLKIKEVREILELHKVNPKESADRIAKYQKDLAARLRAHDRGKRHLDETKPAGELMTDETSSPSASKKPKTDDFETPSSQPKLSRREMAKAQLTGILAQSELALPPSGSPPSDFSVEWIQYFFQSMCSKIPFFPDRKLLVPGPARKYVEESDDQRVYIDGLSSNEIILLLNFVYDLETHLLDNKKKERTIIVPNKFVFIPVMGDPLESGLLDKWYFTHLSQCATCALRFANRKLLTMHHDYHYHKCTAYQRRRRGLENNFRGWMEPPGDWLTGVPFSSSIYSKMHQSITDGFNRLGLRKFVSSDPSAWEVHADGQSGPSVVSAAATQSSAPAPISASHHTARTQTEIKEIIGHVLPESIPVDEIKSKCLECGDDFEKIWIGEPVDLAVYRGVVAVPIGSSVPLQFKWPIASETPENIDSDDEEENQSLNDLGGKLDAVNALAEHRFLNALFLHKHCFMANPRLKIKEYQLSLLESTIAPYTEQLLELLKPPLETRVSEELTVAPDMVQLVQEEDDEEDSSMVIS